MRCASKDDVPEEDWREACHRLWNTAYLSRAVESLRAEGHELPDDLIRHISPQIWEHINLTGIYDWRREPQPKGRPGTLLLPIGVRVPVLAGLAVVVATPHYWAKRMLKVASKGIRDRLVACFRSLLARHLEQAQSLATSRSVSGHPSPKACQCLNSQKSQHK